MRRRPSRPRGRQKKPRPKARCDEEETPIDAGSTLVVLAVAPVALGSGRPRRRGGVFPAAFDARRLAVLARSGRPVLARIGAILPRRGTRSLDAALSPVELAGAFPGAGRVLRLRL